jgi:hypothetical protein
MRISSQHNARRISKHPMGANSLRIMGSTINQWPPNSKSEAPTCAVVPIMEPIRASSTHRRRKKRGHGILICWCGQSLKGLHSVADAASLSS